MHPDNDGHDPEKTCFVISPIGQEGSDVRKRSDQLLNHIITPAAGASSLVTVRSDQIASPGMISAQIIRHIVNDKMVVADLTDHNANVFYELALRHAFGKPVVQMIMTDQTIPFDLKDVRTVHYDLTLDNAVAAREKVKQQIAAALAPDFEVESPVTFVARLEELFKSTTPQTEALMNALLDQVESLNIEMANLNRRVRPMDIAEATIPDYVADQMEDVLKRYSDEIELLRAVRQAGIVDLARRRQSAIKAFARYIDEESREIVVIGSSLKGLLQQDDYQEFAAKLRFKVQQGFAKLKLMLTHPIVADLRASPETRHLTEIGQEIIDSLVVLRDWRVPPEDVRLYLGTPTCFAIKTSRLMLINPYPYASVSYEMPCFILEHSEDKGATGLGYFFDAFNSRHFGAWDSTLAVPIRDYDSTIQYLSSKLEEYAHGIEDLLSRGRIIP